MIFVFGSNELGQSGAGSALAAVKNYEAVYGQGFGPSGSSFAIPTCSKPTSKIGHEISLSKLAYYVDCFILYAKQHPELEFQVTQIGCGLAGWKAEQVAPLFVNASNNCSFDTAWQPFLGEKTTSGVERKYWGHV